MKIIFLISIALIFSIKNVKAFEIEKNPELSITTLDGRNFDLREKRGKIIIINFWAKWCIDCRKEMPILEEIYQKYKSQNVEIIGVNIDHKRQRKKVLEISSTFSYPNAMINEVNKNSFEEPDKIPTIYIINKDGKIAAKIIEIENIKINLEKILNSLN